MAISFFHVHLFSLLDNTIIRKYSLANQSLLKCKVQSRLGQLVLVCPSCRQFPHFLVRDPSPPPLRDEFAPRWDPPRPLPRPRPLVLMELLLAPHSDGHATNFRTCFVVLIVPTILTSIILHKI